MLKKDPKRVSAAVNGTKMRMVARRVADWRSGGRILRKLESNCCTKYALREANMKGQLDECDLLTKNFFVSLYAREITWKMYY